MIPIELVDIFVRLQLPETRQDSLKTLAAYTRAEEAYLFGKDEELGIFLPAQGLPQTMRNAARWHATFARYDAGSCASVSLPSPSSGEGTQCTVVVDKLGLSIIVLVGIALEQSNAMQIQALLPLVGAKLAGERAAVSAAGHAKVVQEASKQAKSLNIALDASRRELQKAFAQLTKELAVRREAEGKLLEADRKKDEFLAMLAHELRNPLAPISMAAQLLRLSSADKRRIEQASQIINRQIEHMTSLLDDLLDVSRVTRGKILLSKEIVDAKVAIADAIEQSKSLIQLKQHQLDVHLAGEEVYVHGDKTRLVQIIANILVNAAKYTPAEGILDLRLDATADEAVITMRDNGIGLDPELLPHIFELFTQAPRSPDRSQGGLGIGLALVKSLVELHGGSVTAQSRGPNPGSEFTVRLPRVHKPMQGPATIAEGAMPAFVQGLAILVVDDNVDAANTLVEFLESLGHRALTAYSANEAMALTTTRNFDVLFLDIGLPDMDGHVLVKRLKESNRCAGTVFVALTGYGQPQDKELSRAAGFDVHLTKPADLRELVDILNEAGRSRRRSVHTT